MATATQSKTYTPEEIAWVAKLWWKSSILHSENSIATAVAIAMAESGGNVYAHNTKWPDDSYGLWQINMRGPLGPARRAQFGLPSNDALFTPAANAEAAYKIYVGAGMSFSPWSTYKDGSYKKHMPRAMQAVGNPKQPGDVGGGPDQVDTIIGGKIYDALLAPVLDFLKASGLRIAGFVGGALLIIMAFRMYSR